MGGAQLPVFPHVQKQQQNSAAIIFFEFDVEQANLCSSEFLDMLQTHFTTSRNNKGFMVKLPKT
jgi:hypothetical protein